MQRCGKSHAAAACLAAAGTHQHCRWPVHPQEMLPPSKGTISLALYEAPSPVPAGTATTPSQSGLARFLLLPLALMID